MFLLDCKKKNRRLSETFVLKLLVNYKVKKLRFYSTTSNTSEHTAKLYAYSLYSSITTSSETKTQCHNREFSYIDSNSIRGYQFRVRYWL
ncbi:hypothetical protein CRE_31124 [Caenorhabditis remanei]|uniref:Uncharacterized protein n=1 Tax=Caenorhabditis remanei TaxID=31234 RepID=E3LUS1_CAERE|nr:hypothetical protein CRE_31124 [Caenorhabditis remanei]